MIYSPKLQTGLTREAAIRALQYLGVSESEWHDTILSVVESEEGVDVVKAVTGERTVYVSFKEMLRQTFLKSPYLATVLHDEVPGVVFA